MFKGNVSRLPKWSTLKHQSSGWDRTVVNLNDKITTVKSFKVST